MPTEMFIQSRENKANPERREMEWRNFSLCEQNDVLGVAESARVALPHPLPGGCRFSNFFFFFLIFRRIERLRTVSTASFPSFTWLMS